MHGGRSRDTGRQPDGERELVQSDAGASSKHRVRRQWRKSHGEDHTGPEPEWYCHDHRDGQ